MGLSTVRYIRSLYPNANIIYCVPKWIAPLFSRTNHDADEIFPLQLANIKDFILLFLALYKRKIDIIFEMHQSGRTRKFFGVFRFLSFFQTSYFFHNHHLKEGNKVLDQGIIKSVIQRDLDGAYSFLDIQKTMIPNYLDFPPQLKLLSKKSINEDIMTIIIGVVATRKTKMWEISSYIELMKMIKNEYILLRKSSVHFIIPLSISKEDEAIKKSLLEFEENGLFSISQSCLADLPEVIAGANLYIGNDTGLKHLAASLGVKTYTFFGPEPPNEWHPYNTLQHKYFFKDPLECRTRESHYCGLFQCDTMLCLNEFTAKFVFEEIKKVLT